MAITAANIVVGLAESATIKIGTYGQVEGAAADIGGTEGGVDLVVARDLYQKTCDQHIGILGLIKTLEDCKLKFSMAEATLDNLRLAIDYPAGALAGSVLSFGGDATVNELTIYVNVAGPSGGTRKYTFHKAVALSCSHSYKKSDKTLYEVEFQIINDTSKAADVQLCYVEDSGVDVTPPTVALTTPLDGGTVAQGTTGPVIWTITEAGTVDENSIRYGDDDDATFMIINTTAPAAAAIEAGTIVYSAVTKTVTFTPTVAWTNLDIFQAIVTTGLRDIAGNHLAAIKIEQFSAA